MHKCSNKLLCPAAVGFSVEADGERRKQGLPSRVTFLNKPDSDTDYQFNGTVELRSRKQEACTKLMGKLKVTQT